MSERTTIKQARAAWSIATRMLGVPFEQGYGTGSLYIDHLMGHGYRIEQVMNEGGGVWCPFGERRLSLYELWLQARTVMDTLDNQERMRELGRKVTLASAEGSN